MRGVSSCAAAGPRVATATKPVETAIDEAKEALLILRYPSLGTLATAREHLERALGALASDE